jgi:3-deoxy-7-phosphoheptulonate synthase
MVPAAILMEELPLTAQAAEVVSTTRQGIREALASERSRLVVVVGPCSIHDPAAALDYAAQLKALADRYAEHLLVVMRTYFEKPRTTVGWKGLINDPDIDGSFLVNKGLRLARALLRDVAALGLPTATEFLDLTVPQHLADLVSWAAIGARTTESQVHRELASGLSMPVGFKNATDGNWRAAADAVEVARSPHWFPGTTKDGLAAIIESSGNDQCHVILRGGSQTGPNYSREHVREVSAALEQRGLPHRLMVDCSHGNSGKDHAKQPLVAEDVARQLEAGGSPIFGVMIESNLVEGRQAPRPGQPLVYGQSITDGCLSLAQTEPLLERLARAAASRSARAP